MKSELPSTVLLGSSEIELHYKRPLFNTMQSITSAEDADKILRSFINENQLDVQERFWVLTLTSAHRLIGITEVTVGSALGVIIDIKTILAIALKSCATNLVVAHNHPSGNLTPSKRDITYTKKLKRACNLLDIKLLDHLIISSESFLSLAYERAI